MGAWLPAAGPSPWPASPRLQGDPWPSWPPDGIPVPVGRGGGGGVSALGAGAAEEGLSPTSTGIRGTRGKGLGRPLAPAGGVARGLMLARAGAPTTPTGAHTCAHTHTRWGCRAHGEADTAPGTGSGGEPSPPGAAHAPRLADAPEPGPITASPVPGGNRRRGRERPPGPPREGEGSRCPGRWPPVPAQPLGGRLGDRGWSERSGPGRPCRPLRAQQAERGHEGGGRGAGRDPGWSPCGAWVSVAPSALSRVPLCRLHSLVW